MSARSIKLRLLFKLSNFKMLTRFDQLPSFFPSMLSVDTHTRRALTHHNHLLSTFRCEGWHVMCESATFVSVEWQHAWQKTGQLVKASQHAESGQFECRTLDAHDKFFLMLRCYQWRCKVQLGPKQLFSRFGGYKLAIWAFAWYDWRIWTLYMPHHLNPTNVLQ